MTQAAVPLICVAGNTLGLIGVGTGLVATLGALQVAAQTYTQILGERPGCCEGDSFAFSALFCRMGMAWHVRAAWLGVVVLARAALTAASHVAA